MSLSTQDILWTIIYNQRQIRLNLHNTQRLKRCIAALDKAPIGIFHLEYTLVGQTINSLREIKHGVGEAAQNLVAKWKQMVVNSYYTERDMDVPVCYSSSKVSPLEAHNSVTLSDNKKNGIHSNKHESSRTNLEQKTRQRDWSCSEDNERRKRRKLNENNFTTVNENTETKLHKENKKPDKIKKLILLKIFKKNCS